MLAATPIPGLSDEFDDAASIGQWQRIHQVEGWNADQLNLWNIDATQSGRMVQQPHTAVWYQNWRGPLAFQEVTGDFVFTTEVHVTDRDDIGGSDPDDVPGDALFSLAGAMIRTPRPINDPAVDWSPGSMMDDGTNNGENYVFLSVGYANGGNEFSLEVKTTRNSNSQLELTSLGPTANTATVQLARIGDSIIALYQLPGEEWQVHRRYSRPDMPATLQVGLVTYTDWEKANDFDPFTQNSTVLQPGMAGDPSPANPFNPDLTAGFEYARYVQPDVPPELVGVDLVNDATDQQLLGFLGDSANVVDNPSPPPLVEIRLEAVDDDGAPLASLFVGQSFHLRAIVDDLRVMGSGVFSSYVDATYDANLAEPSGAPVFGDSFPNAREANLDSPGVIDDAGAVAGTTPTGDAPLLLFSIPMIATAAGTLDVQLSPADLLPDHEVSLFDLSSPVDDDNVVMIGLGLQIVFLSPAAVDDEFTILNTGDPVELDVLANDADTPAAIEALAVVSVPDPVGGTVSITPDGNRVSFTPDDGFYGDTSIEYTVEDSNGQTSTAIATIHVHKAWHNGTLTTDVGRDQHTSPIDALAVINVLNSLGSMPLPQVPPPALAGLPMIDVNNDQQLSPIDALLIITALNNQAAQRSAAGEGADDATQAFSPIGSSSGSPHSAVSASSMLDASAFPSNDAGTETSVLPSSTATSTATGAPSAAVSHGLFGASGGNADSEMSRSVDRVFGAADNLDEIADAEGLEALIGELASAALNV